MNLNDVFAWLKNTFLSLWSKAKPEIVSDFQLFLVTFEANAIDAVKNEALKVISGEEKFNNALSVIEDIVIKAGWKAGTTALETLIQNAYTAFKASEATEGLVTPPGK